MKRHTYSIAARPVFLLFLLAWAHAGFAQQPTFAPFHANGIYDPGEKVGWTATLPPSNAVPSGPYTYTIRKNNFGDPIKSGSLDLSGGTATIELTFPEPAMLFVQVAAPPVPPNPAPVATNAPTEGAAAARGALPARGGRGLGGRGGMTLGAAVAPTKLQPAATRPTDFDAFWEAKIKSLDQIPMNPVLTPTNASRPGIEFATFKLDSVGSNVRGYFAKPAREGKFPAIVIFQWAGVYAVPNAEVQTRASEGWLALNVDSHDKEPSVATGPPNNYQSLGNTNRETSYFLNMYLRDYRALEYITSRPEWDGQTLVVMGTSMGGQQSFCLAGLHPKVTHLIIHVPSGADSNGPLHDRASGYPNWPSANPAIMETALYFDTVNFASRIKATSLVSMGFIDTTSPPAGVWTAFNQIQGPKEVAPMPLAGHNNVSTAAQMLPFTARATEWLNALVKGEAVQPDSTKALPR